MVMWARTVVGCVLLCVAYLSEVCRTDMLMIRHGRSRVRHSSEKDHIRWGLKAFDNLTLDYDLDSYEQNDTSEIGGSGGGNLSTVNINSSEIVYQSNAERESSGPFSTVSTSFYYNGFLSTSAATDSTTNNNYAKSKKEDTKNLTTVINDVERNNVGLNTNGNSINVSSSGNSGVPTKAPKKKLGKKQIMANIRKTVDKGLEYLKSHANLDEINIKILDNEKQMKHSQQVTTTGTTDPALATNLVKINTQPTTVVASVATTVEKIIRNRLEIDNDDENNLRQESEHDNEGSLLEMPERSKKPIEHLYRKESSLPNWLSEIIAPTANVAKTQIPSSSFISVPPSITSHEQTIGLKSMDNNGKNHKIHNKIHSIITGTQIVNNDEDNDASVGNLDREKTLSAEVDMMMSKADAINMNDEKLSRTVGPPQQDVNHKRLFGSQTTRDRFSYSNINANNKKKRNKITNRKNGGEDINNYNFGSMVKGVSVSDGTDLQQPANINHNKEDIQENIFSLTLKPPTASTVVIEQKPTSKRYENLSNVPYLDSSRHMPTSGENKIKNPDSFQQEEQTKFVKIFRPDEIETYFNHSDFGDKNLEENFDLNGVESRLTIKFKNRNNDGVDESGTELLKPSGFYANDDEDGDESFVDSILVNDSGLDGDNNEDNNDLNIGDNASQNIDDVDSNGYQDRTTFNEDLKNIFRMEDIDLQDLDETSRNNRLNLMKGEDVVTKFLQIVESQHLLGANCTAGTALNLGEGVVDRYAQDRFRVEAEVAVNRANMLTRIFKLTSPAVQASEHLLHASVLSMVEFDDDIFAAGNCFDWNQHPLKKGLFCPFAYRLPPPEQGASLAKDLAAEYHYLGNTSEWFFLARKNAEKVIARNEQYIKAYHLYANSTTRQADEILSVKYEDGRWSKPYYDCGGGNIWMLTYTVPFFGYENGTYFFKGTSGIDIDLRRVDIDQCPQRNTGSAQPLNIFAGTDKCKQRTTECKPIPGLGFRRGSYKCICRRGFYFPDTNIPQKYFNGSTLEEEYEKLMLRELSMYKIPATYECLPCAEGCDSCMDASPCVAALNWPMRTSILVLACAVIGLLPPAALFTFRYQQVKVVRAASPALLRVIALGAFFIYCTSIVMYPPPSIYACTARVWLREIGFSLTYGALMLKTWRISVIFRVRSAKAVKITDAALLKRLGILCGAVGAALLVRTIVAPPFVVVGRTADNLKAYLCRTDWWDHTFTSMEVLFLAWGVRLCIMVRKAPSEFNESRFISMAIYNEFLLTCFLNVSMLFLQSPANPDLLYIIFFCHTQLTVTLLLALIFGSKVYMVFRGGGKPPEDAMGLGAKSSAPKFNFRSQGRSMGNPSTATSSTAQFGAHMGTDVRLTEQEALEEIRQMCSQLQRLQDRVPPRGVAVATISALLESCRASHPLTLKPPLLSIAAAKMNDIGVKHVDKSTNTNTCCCDGKPSNFSQINNGGIARIAITDVTDKTSLQNNNKQQQQELKKKLMQLQLVQSSEKLNQNISNSASSTSVSAKRQPAGDGCGTDTNCALVNKCEKPSKCINKKKMIKSLTINDKHLDGGGTGCVSDGNNAKRKVCTYQDNNIAQHYVNSDSIEHNCNLDFANLQLECMCSASSDDFNNSEEIINTTTISSNAIASNVTLSGRETNNINIANDNVIEKHKCCLNNYKHCKNEKFLNLDDDNNKYVKNSVSNNNNNVSNNKISGSSNYSLSSTCNITNNNNNNNNQIITDVNIKYCDDGNVVRCDISNNCSSTSSTAVAVAAAAAAGNSSVPTTPADYIGDKCGCGYNYDDNDSTIGATSITPITAAGDADGGCDIHSSDCCFINKKIKPHHHHNHPHHQQYDDDDDNDNVDNNVNCAFSKKYRDDTVNKLNKINLCDKLCENLGDNNLIKNKKLSKNSIDNKIINLNEVNEGDASNDNDNDDIYCKNSKLYDDTSSVIVQLSDGDDEDDVNVEEENADDTICIHVADSDDSINVKTTNIKQNQNVNNKAANKDNCASCSWQFLDSLDSNPHDSQVTNELISDNDKLSKVVTDTSLQSAEQEQNQSDEKELSEGEATTNAASTSKKRSAKTDGSGRLVLDLNDRSKYTKEVSV